MMAVQVNHGAKRAAWQLANETTPIILAGGIAQAQGNALPIISLLQPTINVTATANGVVVPASIGYNSTNIDSLNNALCKFWPMPGSTLLTATVGQYPFANQGIAGNAIIQMPTNLSMMMSCPAGVGGVTFGSRLTTITGLIASLKQHSVLGGTYSVVTPVYIYKNGILTQIQDVSGGESHQAQYLYRWDFYFPLVAISDLQQAQTGFIQQLTNGNASSGTPQYTQGAANSIGNVNQQYFQSLTPPSLPLSSLGF